METDVKRISELLIKIGKKISEDPLFVKKLEDFLKVESFKKKEHVDLEKVNNIDLFSLVRESEQKLISILSELSLLELKALLKRYHFGSSSKLKSRALIQAHILNQLRNRKTDVFQVTDNA